MANDSFDPRIIAEDAGYPDYDGATIDHAPSPQGGDVAVVEHNHEILKRSLRMRNSEFQVRSIIPQTYEEAFRFAQLYHQTGMAPAGLDTPQKITIAMLTGMELGLKPIAALSGIAVINKRPAIFGDLALALIRSRGVLEDFDETFSGNPYDDDYTATCLMHRRGDKRSVVRSFSVADAIKAKLWSPDAQIERWMWKKGGARGEKTYFTVDNDSPWYRFPKRMLQMRARGFTSRDACPDILKGVPFAEELQDVEDRRIAAIEATGDEAPPVPASPVHGFGPRPATAAIKSTALSGQRQDNAGEAPAAPEEEKRPLKPHPEKSPETTRSSPEADASSHKLKAFLAQIQAAKDDDAVRRIYVQSQGVLLNADAETLRGAIEDRRRQFEQTSLDDKAHQPAFDWPAWIAEAKPAINAQKTVKGVRAAFHKIIDAAPHNVPDPVRLDLVKMCNAREEEINSPPPASGDVDQGAKSARRFFFHPESDSMMITTDGTHAGEPGGDGSLVEEVTEAQYWSTFVNRFRAQLMNTRSIDEAHALFDKAIADDPPRVDRERMQTMVETHTAKMSSPDTSVAEAREARDAERERQSDRLDPQEVAATMRKMTSSAEIKDYYENTWLTNPHASTYSDDDQAFVKEIAEKRIKIAMGKGK